MSPSCLVDLRRGAPFEPDHPSLSTKTIPWSSDPDAVAEAQATLEQRRAAAYDSAEYTFDLNGPSF
jgi:hypothetical protein